ncbi:type III secretion system protein [Burkholderia thailandensis]|uniref:Type III secretion system protein n=2 Tax=Burkholderia thailandensis TaxID=57975 RepID=A0AAW9CT09_BURTH|nr:type III secretion system protein [Burkholderia thailandensis]MCS3392303.1 type III secretion system protein [Burkholderia thailandensis]MCS6427865.1 type III secretion system protein [Burkholderia thailandensis]MCS6453424.1 type III secretion system protein [Burkholderia thailandensis]MCS6467032.1 type III secretion system protein [Burkholderia thailandensis]MCS6476052.1 type III secretion system protein [Burkholderia thailandensis]
MSRVTRAIAHTVHAAKHDPRRRRPVRARVATTYGKYGTRFAYSNGYQASAMAARNQMLAKLKPRPKTAAAGARRRRADSQGEAFDVGDEALAPHAHVAPRDEHGGHGGHAGGHGGGRQQRDQDERDGEPANVFELSRVRAARALPASAPAAAPRALRDIARTLAHGAQREQALRHLWADTLLQLGRHADAQPDARITAALLDHSADLLAARLRTGPWTPIGWSGVKQLLLDATQGAGGAARDMSAAHGERARTHFLLLPLLVFNAERPSTNAQLARARASVETLRGGIALAQRPRS